MPDHPGQYGGEPLTVTLPDIPELIGRFINSKINSFFNKHFKPLRGNISLKLSWSNFYKNIPMVFVSNIFRSVSQDV